MNMFISTEWTHFDRWKNVNWRLGLGLLSLKMSNAVVIDSKQIWVNGTRNMKISLVSADSRSASVKLYDDTNGKEFRKSAPMLDIGSDRVTELWRRKTLASVQLEQASNSTNFRPIFNETRTGRLLSDFWVQGEALGRKIN